VVKEDAYTTSSGRDVKLRIYTQPANISQVRAWRVCVVLLRGGVQPLVVSWVCARVLVSIHVRATTACAPCMLVLLSMLGGCLARVTG
jgi:hypothetical protein